MEEEKPQEQMIREPNTYDYLAGAMLANGIVWIWLQALVAFKGFFLQIPVGILADMSYVIYLVGAAIASKQVCKRADSGHLVVGLKFAGFSWVMALFMMMSMAPQPTMGLVITFIVCFAAGGIAGAYWVIRDRLKKSRNSDSGGSRGSH